MKSFRLLILGVTLIVVVFVVFLVRAPLVHFLTNLRTLISGAADPAFSYESYENLKMQNEILNQNSLVSAKSNLSRSGRYEYKEAQVFSDYPFNNYAAITIDAGSDDGVRAGMPVLASLGVLLGKIREVKRTQSEVETIFDPGWRSAAAFGNNRSRALLVGGPAPYLDLISKETPSIEGDPVFNLAKDFPINLLVGKILSRESGGEDVWNKAKLEPPFHFDAVRSILIVLNFP